MPWWTPRNPVFRRIIASIAVALLVVVALPARAQTDDTQEKKQLVVGTKVVKPFAFRTPEGKWTGISIELFEEMNRKLGYELVWKESPSTNALIDDVAEHRVDLGVAAITMNPARAERVDFTNSMYRAGLGIAVRSQAQGTLGALEDLVSLRVLGGVGLFLGVILAVGVLIWLVERRKNPDFEASARAGIWSGFWWSAVTMTTVGYGDKAPKTPLGRVFGLIWMFSSIILISGFTATVASQLTAERFESTVKGEDDLRHVKVGAKAGENPESVLKNLGVTPVAYASIADGLTALDEGEIDAFVHDAPVLQYEIISRPGLDRRVSVLPKLMRVEEYGIACARPTDPSRRNDLRDRINLEMLAVKANGRVDEITRSYLGDQ